MSKTARIVLAGTALVLLAACAEGVHLEDDYTAAQSAEPQGSAFNRHLYASYLEISTAERSEYDWADSGHFATKALSAAADEQVSPDPVYTRRLPTGTTAELKDARRQLTNALERGARGKTPQDAATAQTSFDCWLQEQEENHQSEDIAACRDRFYTTLAKVQSKLDLPVARAPASPKDGYLVFFDLDSTKLDDQGVKTVEAVATELKAGVATKVVLTGHADRAGSDAFNMGLSERRLEVVKQLLLSAGLKAEQIELTPYGETRPRVTTGDNVTAPENRRVEIELAK
jgi:outer membrane protein OmpA-like peptidoglycan-associated protein